MKKIFYMVLVISLVLLVCPAAFGITSDTPSPQEETDVVHSGNRSLKFMKIKSIDGSGKPLYVPWGKAFYGYLSLKEGKTYRISMWVKIPEAKNRNDIKFFANLAWVLPEYVESLGGRTPWISDGITNIKYPTPPLQTAVQGTVFTDDEWHQITTYYTVAAKGDLSALNPSPGTSDTYGMQIWTEEKPSADPMTQPVYLDDFEVVEVDAESKAVIGENLFENPGFEDKLSQIPINWSNCISVYYGVGTKYTEPQEESESSSSDVSEENGNEPTGEGSSSSVSEKDSNVPTDGAGGDGGGGASFSVSGGDSNTSTGDNGLPWTYAVLMLILLLGVSCGFVVYRKKRSKSNQ